MGIENILKLLKKFKPDLGEKVFKSRIPEDMAERLLGKSFSSPATAEQAAKFKRLRALKLAGGIAAGGAALGGGAAAAMSGNDEDDDSTDADDSKEMMRKKMQKVRAYM